MNDGNVWINSHVCSFITLSLNEKGGICYKHHNFFHA